MSRAFRARRRLGLPRASFKSTAMRLKGRLAHRRKRRSFRPGFDRTGGKFRFAGSRELKFHDVDSSDAIVAATGAIQPALLTIAQGTNAGNRIGRQITLKSIMVKWSMKLPSTASMTQTVDHCRVMIIQDKQCNGALPTVGNVLLQTDFLSFNNLDNKRRFRTLMDRQYDFQSAAGIAGPVTGEDMISDTFYKKVSMPIEYSSTSGVIAEVRSNNIFILLISTDGLISFDAKVRFRFSDS